MTRRTFLRVLGSAAITAAAVQAIPFNLSSAAIEVSAGSLWGTTTTGPLAYEILQQAYESCVIGEHEPNLMVMSSSMARRLGLVYDVECEEAAA